MFILRKADWSQYASEPILSDDSEYDSTGENRSRYDDGPSNSEPLGGGSYREDQIVDDGDDGAESDHAVAEDDQQESNTEAISVLDDRQDVKPVVQKKRRRIQPPTSVKAAKPRTGILRVKGVPPPEDYKHLFEGVAMPDAPRRGQNDVGNRVLKPPVPSPEVAKPSPTKHRTLRNRKT
ncbi:hypothetical protein HETIRDRAFT_449254 [Heterobasidion irregulare TC 32-1]|uniref:Uncharacterized protein n=1 Tax=Heterobasidion irregulare (strain TC 32-1) TaxID=747525 RepID=W4KCF4_HETIT|nr:uncharacterized protein HETIRDRAFT_449254 [Heterobasidion irregulare TC 32-1]ETW83547.1 hypothetical protein HETIRDRAFT_449254 [Heterobasidion irregulare TC 32-1]